MNPLTLEWVDKVEGDYLTANREYRVRKAPNYDAVCFHAQQASEKYLKAVLQENAKSIPRIHSLVELLALVSKIDPSYLMVQVDLNIMETYAVQFRYPGMSDDRDEAKTSLSAAGRVRSFVRAKFNY